MIDQSELLPMDTAPRDGMPIMIRFEHMNFKYARKDDDGGARWEALQEAHWIEHNGGGWTWHGMAGTPTGWKPKRQRPGVDRRGPGVSGGNPNQTDI